MLLFNKEDQQELFLSYFNNPIKSLLGIVQYVQLFNFLFYCTFISYNLI